MQVVVNNSGVTTDITNYIVEGTYKMDSDDAYESWEDGWKVEHRIITGSKVTGSFQIVCSNRSNSITLNDFLTIWNGAVNDGVITLGVYVNNKGAVEAIEAYFTMDNVKHDRAGDGSFIDVFEIKIKER